MHNVQELFRKKSFNFKVEEAMFFKRIVLYNIESGGAGDVGVCFQKVRNLGYGFHGELGDKCTHALRRENRTKKDKHLGKTSRRTAKRKHK